MDVHNPAEMLHALQRMREIDRRRHEAEPSSPEFHRASADLERRAAEIFRSTDPGPIHEFARRVERGALEDEVATELREPVLPGLDPLDDI